MTNTDTPVPTDHNLTSIRCTDGECLLPERARCACMIGVQVYLEVEHVRACFQGSLLARGESIGQLSIERHVRLFPPPNRSRCGRSHYNASQRLARFAAELAIPAPSDADREEQPRLAQARARARRAVEKLTWSELRLLVLATRKLGDLAPTERADRIRSIATGLWLRRGARPK